MSAKGWAIGLVAFVAIAGSCSTEESSSSTAASSAAPPVTSSLPTSTPSYTAPVAAPTSAAPAGDTVTVARVIDGDSFEIAGGDEVRVLGIDSCEMATYGGRQAKQSAELYLDGESVVLEREPGAEDRDRYGRLLRYVSTTYGSDFGEIMVSSDHTGVYRGGNDASATRLAALRELDDTGRDCSAPDYTPSTTEYEVDVDLDDDVNLPDGALTGGYCARKWWC